MRNLQNFTKFFFSPHIILILLLILPTQPIYANIPGAEELNLTLPLRECWVYPVSKNIVQITASDNANELYLADSNGMMVGLNSDTGQMLWKSELGGRIVSEILFDDLQIYLVTRTENESKLRSISKTSGLSIWETKLPSSNLKSATVYLHNNTDNIILVGMDSSVIWINKSDGHIQKLQELNLEILDILSVNSELLIGMTNNLEFVEYYLSSNKIYRKISVLSQPTAFLGTIANQSLIWGDKKGVLTSAKFLPETNNKYKKKWVVRIGGEISHIVQTTKGLIATSFDNFIYMIEEDNGEIIWKKRFAGRIAYKPLITGNFAVVNVVGDSAAYILDVSSGKVVNKVIVENNNYFVNPTYKVADKIVFSTSKGIYSFSNKNC